MEALALLIVYAFYFFSEAFEDERHVRIRNRGLRNARERKRLDKTYNLHRDEIEDESDSDYWHKSNALRQAGLAIMFVTLLVLLKEEYKYFVLIVSIGLLKLLVFNPMLHKLIGFDRPFKDLGDLSGLDGVLYKLFGDWWWFACLTFFLGTINVLIWV